MMGGDWGIGRCEVGRGDSRIAPTGMPPRSRYAAPLNLPLKGEGKWGFAKCGWAMSPDGVAAVYWDGGSGYEVGGV